MEEKAKLTFLKGVWDFVLAHGIFRKGEEEMQEFVDGCLDALTDAEVREAKIKNFYAYGKQVAKNRYADRMSKTGGADELRADELLGDELEEWPDDADLMRQEKISMDPAEEMERDEAEMEQFCARFFQPALTRTPSAQETALRDKGKRNVAAFEWTRQQTCVTRKRGKKVLDWNALNLRILWELLGDKKFVALMTFLGAQKNPAHRTIIIPSLARQKSAWLKSAASRMMAKLVRDSSKKELGNAAVLNEYSVPCTRKDIAEDFGISEARLSEIVEENEKALEGRFFPEPEGSNIDADANSALLVLLSRLQGILRRS